MRKIKQKEEKMKRKIFRIVLFVIVFFMGAMCAGCGKKQVSEIQMTPDKNDSLDSEINSGLSDALPQLTEPTPTMTVAPTKPPIPTAAPERAFTMASYPTINADIPDPDIIRVGETYYMVSTTMNLCPGVPIMKSTDLVHWQIVRYVYDTFASDDITNLENGKDMYSRGSWAASIRYDEALQIYLICFNSNDHGFFVYTTPDLEKGSFSKYTSSFYFHDPGLFIEGENIYVISASGGNCTMQKIGLDPEHMRVEKSGAPIKLFSSKDWALWEGAHVYKVGEYYYIFIIASPKNRWMRTQLCYRSKTLAPGSWEEKIVYQGGSGNQSAGLAQGGIIETQFGDWYAFLFQDRGATGRVPSVVAVEWQEDWPLLGTYNMAGKFMQNQSSYAMRVYLPEDENGNAFTGNDDFSYEKEEDLKVVWQWNHNPKEEYWSVTERPGFLRLRTDKTVNNLFEAHNSLTQRTVGPQCTSEILLDAGKIKKGDYTGIAAVASAYGMVGVMRDEKDDLYLFQANAEFKQAFETPNEAILLEPTRNGTVFLKIQYDLKGETADFFYSYDKESWNSIGKRMRLGFSTNTTFMGTRSWLFYFATLETGGIADFDSYEICLE